jgi:hypothetical protein
MKKLMIASIAAAGLLLPGVLGAAEHDRETMSQRAEDPWAGKVPVAVLPSPITPENTSSCFLLGTGVGDHKQVINEYAQGKLTDRYGAEIAVPEAGPPSPGFLLYCDDNDQKAVENQYAR